MKRLLTFLTAALAALSMQAQPTPVQGISRIIAGTNITISPSSGTGSTITINASGGGGPGTVTNVTSANAEIGVATGTTTPVLTLGSTFGAKTFTDQITSTVSTGTAPLVIASTTLVANLTAASAGSATNAVNIAVIDDTSTNGTMNLLWATAATGNLPAKVSSTGLNYNPSTSQLTVNGPVSGVSLLTAGAITGGAGNMTITAGTGNSRTMILRSTTSGGTATTFLTGDASQNTTLAGNLTLGASTSSILGAAGNMTITAGTGNSRTMALQSTTSGGTATTFLTGNADQTLTIPGSFIRTPATITVSAGAGTIDITKGFLQASVVAATALTVSANGTSGEQIRVDVTTDSTLRVVTFKNLDASTILAISCPASTTTPIVLTSTGAAWTVTGGSPSLIDASASTTPASTVLLMTVDPTTGAVTKSTIAQVATPANIPVGAFAAGQTLTTPVFAGGNTASGSGANTWASSTGTFITSTGLNTLSGATTLAPAARATGIASYWTVTTPADTNMTASTESIGANWAAATRQWATGSLTTQREHVYAAPTYAFVGSSTLTTAINVDIADPIQGTNATITNKYGLRVNNQQITGTLTANTGTNQLGPLVDSVDGSTPLNNIIQTVASGTAYTLTATSAAVTFGTTSPIVTTLNAGTYWISCDIQYSYVGATFAANRQFDAKLRRTNNTPGDVSGSTFSEFVPILTTITDAGPHTHIGPVLYTTANTTDTVQVFADISTLPSAGTVTVTACTITAMRAF